MRRTAEMDRRPFNRPWPVSGIAPRWEAPATALHPCERLSRVNASSPPCPGRKGHVAMPLLLVQGVCFHPPLPSGRARAITLAVLFWIAYTRSPGASRGSEGTEAGRLATTGRGSITGEARNLFSCGRTRGWLSSGRSRCVNRKAGPGDDPICRDGSPALEPSGRTGIRTAYRSR